MCKGKMRCIVPGCVVDATSVSTCEGETLHTFSRYCPYSRFPAESTLRDTWLKSLNMKGWEFTADNAVCSRHFYKDDLYVSRDGRYTVRLGAVPIAFEKNTLKKDNCRTPCDLKICRACFATDCNLYSMTNYKSLDQAYEILTGLSIENNDNLPSYLCTECSYRLLKCIEFRSRIIQANLMMQEIVYKQDRLSLEAINTCDGYQLLSSKLGITHKKVDQYDLEIEHVETDNTNSDEQEPSSVYVVNTIKIERDEMLHEEVLDDQNAAYDSVCPPRLHQVIVPGIKLEKDDMYNESSPSYEDTINNYNKDINTSDDSTGTKVKVEAIEITNRGSVDESCTDADHIPNGEAPKGEDYSPDDNLYLGEQELGSDLMKKVKKVISVPKKIIDQHPEPPEVHDRLAVSDSPLLVECSYRGRRNVQLSNQLKTNDGNKSVYSRKSMLKINGKRRGRKRRGRKQELICDICKKSYSRRDKLQLHIMTHVGLKPYCCSVCKNAFITKHKLSIHMRIHSGEKPYKCTECDKSFSQKGNLNTHLRIHTGVKPFSCVYCFKTFTQKCTLNKHLKMHSNEKPYSCNICDKSFSLKCYLAKHMRIHSYEKRYSCKYCNKGFDENSRFQNHLRVHLDEKSFTCNMCDKAFSTKSRLQSHLKIHSEEKPYVCYICAKVFRHRNHLISHLRTHSQ